MIIQRNKIIITRIFNAPREYVWKAWTDPELLKKWWGPKNFTTTLYETDLKVGGTYFNCMRSPEGKNYYSKGFFREIVPLNKIVCTDSFADEKANPVSATHYGMSEEFPIEMEISVTFEDTDNKTRLTLTHFPIPPGKDFEECKQGWNESLDKLEEQLEEVIEESKEIKKYAQKTNPVPESFHTVTPNLVIRGAKKAIEFYKRVFGAEVMFLMERPDGKVSHATIRIGDSVLMIGDECSPHQGHEETCVRSPDDIGGTSINLYVYVEDVDSVYDRALKNGALISMPLSYMFWGDRVTMFKDPFGHFWSVATHVKDVSASELKEAAEKFYKEPQAVA